MVAISEEQRKREWRALVEQYPQEFTWDGDTYTGRLTDTRSFSVDPVIGGMIQNQTATLHCLRESFTDGTPGEGDIISCRGLGWRVASIRLVMSFGIILELEGPDRR